MTLRASLSSSPSSPSSPSLRWAMVSTYPPTPCGLATFTHSLVSGMSSLGSEVDVVRVVDGPPNSSSAEVSHHLVSGTPGAAAATAAVLNSYDVVVFQHEYGIYGGVDGEEIIAVLVRLRVPVITVLHTVLAAPTAHQRRVLQSVVEASDVLVTMTRTARDRVIEAYGADPERVHLIPHGAADALVTGSRPVPVRQRGERRRDISLPVATHHRPFILTWGLLGAGKGIEWGI